MSPHPTPNDSSQQAHGAPADQPTRATTWSRKANRIIERAERDGTLEKVTVTGDPSIGESVEIIIFGGNYATWFTTVQVFVSRLRGSTRDGRTMAFRYNPGLRNRRTGLRDSRRISTIRDLYYWIGEAAEDQRKWGQ